MSSKYFHFARKMAAALDRKLLKLRNTYRYKVQPSFNTSIVLFVLSLAITATAIWLLKTNRIDSLVTLDSPSTFFFIAGSMIGAMLAIVFAFSSQLASRASEGLPTRFFSEFAKDHRLDLYYLLIGAIAITEMTFGLIIGLNDSTVLRGTGWILIWWAFVILYLSYARMIEILSHEYQVKFLAKKYAKKIEELKYLAKRFARIERLKDGIDKREQKRVESAIYEGLGLRIQDLHADIQGLVELHFNFRSKGDFYAADNFLSVATGLTMGYILSRKDNTSLRPNRDLPVLPDSDLSDFIQKSFEALSPVWRTALEGSDSLIIKSYLRNTQGIVRSTLYVSNLDQRYENPAFQAAFFNLRSLIEDSVKNSNIDALFELPSVLSQVGELAINTKYSIDSLDQVLEQMQVLIIKAASSKELHTINYSLADNMLPLINKALSSKELPDKNVKKIEEVLTQFLIAVLVPDNSPTTQIKVDVFIDNLLATSLKDINQADQEAYSLRVIQITGLLISISEKVAKVASYSIHIVSGYFRHLPSTTRMIFEIKKNGVYSEDTKRIIESLLVDIARLPTLLKSRHQFSGSSDIEDLIDKLIQCALIGLEVGEYDFAKEIFDYLVRYLDEPLTEKKSKKDV